jgi:transposase
MDGESVAVHVVTTTREYKGKVYRAHLLRRSYREDGKVKNETLGNISSLPDHVVDVIRRALKGTPLASTEDLFEITRSWHHGGVQAVLTAMSRLDFDSLLASRPSRERQLVKGMVAARLLEAQSKLATTRWWGTTTLPLELGIEDATENELYEAMDWLLERQDRIEQRLSVRHLDEGRLVFFDLSSTYFEGTSCPLAALGHNRDGKSGLLQVNFGLVTNREGCPVGVSVHPGNTGDPKTLLPQLRRLREVHGILHVVLVGDRGMISQKQIDAVAADESVDWITALRSQSIRTLVDSGSLQMGLFDKRNLFELAAPEFPGERLIACRNDALRELRARKRTELIEATRKRLDKVVKRVKAGRLQGKAEIGMVVGRVINTYKVAKHFLAHIKPTSLSYEVRTDRVKAEAALDGVYIVRTSLPKKLLSAEDTVRGYKALSEVERAFRSFKGVQLKLRPIFHHLENRVRAHIFLCMLAYYVEWHMLNAWRPVLFADEELEAKKQRDPVAPSRRSKSAELKVRSCQLPDGTTAHSFHTRLLDLASIVRNRCRRKGAPETEPAFVMTTIPNEQQRRALELLETIRL